MRQGIAGDKYPDTVRVGIINTYAHISLTEIGGGGTHTELLTCKIDGIGAEIDGGFKPFKVTRRTQKLGLGNFYFRHTFPLISADPQALILELTDDLIVLFIGLGEVELHILIGNKEEILAFLIGIKCGIDGIDTR